MGQHCRLVPILTELIADAVCSAGSGPLGLPALAGGALRAADRGPAPRLRQDRHPRPRDGQGDQAGDDLRPHRAGADPLRDPAPRRRDPRLRGERRQSSRSPHPPGRAGTARRRSRLPRASEPRRRVDAGERPGAHRADREPARVDGVGRRPPSDAAGRRGPQPLDLARHPQPGGAQDHQRRTWSPPSTCCRSCPSRPSCRTSRRSRAHTTNGSTGPATPRASRVNSSTCSRAFSAWRTSSRP